MTMKRLYHDIADKIVALINDGVFPVGTRLPGERELAERFDVSRVTIREAEIALQAIGHLEIKTGSGVYVCAKQPKAEGSLPNVSAFELTEARSLIESEAAALAAKVVDDSQLKELSMLLDKMADADEETANKADRLFHAKIAEASGNKAMIHSVETLWRMREELPEVRSAYAAVCHDDAESRKAEHKLILDALIAHNPEAARSAMKAHFFRLIEAMLDVTEKQALFEVQQRANASRERFLATAQLN
ncbi:FadR/GntR family transcriptional regulator [Sphingorhabdus arenilitoris]|uniref:FadR/GntR family transcriptional regulator n=1 Tax=Sphingorhabdus arenilitoris TaxID=1490041 RepID=A0ABV8RGK6_9SPHN